MDGGWWILIFGALIATSGIVLICFRFRISEFMSRRAFGSPKNPATAITLGAAFTLFGGVMTWSGITQLW